MAHDPLAGLFGQTIDIIRRLSTETGRVEYHGKAFTFSTSAAEQQVINSGLATVKKTPKGRKAWFILTDAGRALIPTIKERDRVAAQELVDYEQAEIAKATLEVAAPVMLAALQRTDNFLSRLTPTGNIASLHLVVREAIAKATTP